MSAMIKHGISFVPDLDDILKLIKCQKYLEAYLPEITPKLGTTFNVPHITLIQGQIKEINYKKVLIDIFNQLKVTDLKFRIHGCKTYQDGWVFLLIEPSNILEEIHLQSFEAIKNHMISPSKEDVEKKLPYYNEIEKSYFTKYGHRYIKEAYLPHITLGKIENSKEVDAIFIDNQINQYLKNKELHYINLSKLSYHEIANFGNYTKEIFSLLLK
jgi:2'-5' RNA ligase